MTTMAKIKEAVQALPEDQFWEFSSWFNLMRASALAHRRSSLC